MSNTIETQHIIFEGQGKAEIFSFRPENIEKEKRGNLFLVGKIAKHLSPQDVSYYALNSIAAILKKEYYSSSHGQSIEAFEGALKKANSHLAKLNQETTKLLELAAFALSGNQVAFSCIGNCEVLLVRNERLFRLAKHHPQKKHLFLHVTRGKVKTQDTIIIASSQLTYWLEHSSFSGRLLKRPWERTIEQLRKERSEAKDTNSWAILKITLRASNEYASLAKEEGNMQEIAQPTFLQSESPASLVIAKKEPWSFAEVLNTAKHYWNKWNINHYAFVFFSRLKQFTSQSARVLSDLMRNVSSLNASRYIRQTNRFSSVKNVIVPSVVGIVIVIGLIIFMGSRTRLIKDTQANTANSAQEGLIMALPKDMAINKALINPYGAYIISQNKLFRLNTATKKIESFLSFSGEVKTIASSSQYLYVVEKGIDGNFTIDTITLLSPSIKKDTLTWPLSAEHMGKALEYQGNLYILESQLGQVVKYKIPQFSKPMEWVTKKTQNQMTNALDFSVDNSLYVIPQTKTSILQLRLGQITNTINLGVNTQASSIITSPEFKNLYVFDTIKGQLSIINKKTLTLASTVSNVKITDLKAVAIDESQNLMSIVTSQGLFSLSMQENKTLP